MSDKRKVPVIATIVVLAAVAIMVALGFWQLGRLEEKEALIARYASAADLPAVELSDLREAGDLQFRRVRIACPSPFGWEAVAGRNRNGQTGYVHRYTCQTQSVRGSDHPDGHIVVYGEIGWSPGPDQPDWTGGDIEGVLAPLGDNFKLVSATPYAGLEASALPDPGELPNNHLAYAVQWFLFALTALVIYPLALHRRWRDKG